MVRQAIQKCGCHFGITKDGGPLAERQIGCNDDRGSLVELAYKVEQQLSSCLSEWQVTQLVENNKVETVEIFRGSALFPVACFCFKAIDEINNIEETATCAIANERARNGNGQMAFSCSRATNKNNISLIAHKNARGQLANQTFVDWGAGKVEVLNVFSKR